jgi:benzodiazapine receptor
MHTDSEPRPAFDRAALVSLGAFLLLCFGAAALGGLVTAPATGPADGWYAQLVKPTWNPPSWLFGPAWTVLYAMMAVAAWLVWRRANPEARRRPMVVFGVQLALNVLWSVIFFGLGRVDLAVIEILGLWAAILATIAVFRPISRAAALLLVPYLLWVSFAAALNITIWRLNAG